MSIHRHYLTQCSWLNDPLAQRAVHAIKDAGFEARFVGGCVRDGLLCQTLKNVDLDIATCATPEEICKIFAGHRIIEQERAFEHGTVFVLIEGKTFEITSLRRDVATDGRHANVEFGGDFQTDAARRDLTINAMSCDAEGTVFDYFGGFEDLLEGRIRFVGEPATRIKEDYLRILRFFRFFARYGRQQPDQATLAAICDLGSGLESLPGERLRKEIKGLLLARQALEALRLMVACGLSEQVFGADINPEGLSTLNEPDCWIVFLAAIIKIPEALKTVADKLKLSNKEYQMLQALLQSPVEQKKLTLDDHRRGLYRDGVEIWKAKLSLALSRGLLVEHDLLADEMIVPVLPVGGKDLMELGLSPGPEIGTHLRAVEEHWLEHGCHLSRDECLDWLKKEVGGTQDR